MSAVDLFHDLIFCIFFPCSSQRIVDFICLHSVRNTPWLGGYFTRRGLAINPTIKGLSEAFEENGLVFRLYIYSREKKLKDNEPL